MSLNALGKLECGAGAVRERANDSCFIGGERTVALWHNSRDGEVSIFPEFMTATHMKRSVEIHT